jgi:hypothetical protein
MDECRQLLLAATQLGTHLAEKDFAHIFLLYNLVPVRGAGLDVMVIA